MSKRKEKKRKQICYTAQHPCGTARYRFKLHVCEVKGQTSSFAEDLMSRILLYYLIVDKGF